MKRLSDFVTEQDMGTGPQIAQEGEGADDKLYLTLMSEYKKMRQMDPQGAQDIMTKARQLANTGDVSLEAKTAAAYL